MLENHREEDMWATMHCTSVLLKKISDKRVTANQSQSNAILISRNELCVAKSKEDNLALFLALISSKSLKSLSTTIIKDMYEYNFDDFSSVDFKIEGLSNNSSLESLVSISLLYHSFGVLNMMNKIIDKKFGLYSDLFYIAGLVHDFGKNNKLKSAYGIDTDIPHHEASSEYLKKINHKDKNVSRYYGDLLNMVCEVFEAHHTKNLENLFYATKREEDSKEFQILLMKYLKQSDSMQRELELELLKNDI